MRSLVLSELSIPERHGLLLGAVGPRPIALASTISATGVPNLAPFSFFNCFGSNPPILIFSPARRGRDNTTKHTYLNAKAVPEVVVHAVSHAMLHQMNMASCEFPDGVNEFEKAGFTQVPSQQVRPFRVKESPVQMECVVEQVVETGQEGAAGNLIICRVLVMHIAEEVLNEKGTIDPHRMDLVARLGGHWYCRAHGDALFELPQPAHLGMGLDRLPERIRLSPVLTGNDLGQLGAVASLPDETSVNDHKHAELSELFGALRSEPKELEIAIHERARTFLREGKVTEAWMTLLAFEHH
jgi:flavin reductase (DIM6/NTAB) family NADH-FMN oxidoreductase RutF